jgi:hypothetical protein
MNLKYEKITKAIIGAAFEVYNILGYGFLEKVYHVRCRLSYYSEAIHQN